MADKTLKAYFNRRWSSMDTEYSSFRAHHKELAEMIKPRRGRFFTQDRNKGDKRYSKIINSRATQAHSTARAGLFAGTMSPSRPWFKLGTPDPSLNQFEAVKYWLEDVENLIRSIFNGSNLYNMAPTMLGELVLFGTGAMSHMDDAEKISRFFTHTAGSYRIAQNANLEVDTFAREYEMSVSQMVGDFGVENVSALVKTQWDNGDYDVWHPVRHFIEPNPNVDLDREGNKFMPFRSVKYEKGTESNVGSEKFLKVSGFNEFPVYVPRWEVTAEDVYGTDCPAMTALGDINGLQVQEKRKAQGIDKMVAPPLKGPAALRNKPVSQMPGGLTIYDTTADREGLTPIYQVNPQVRELALDMDRVEQRINEAFMVDLFLAISNMAGIQPRNERELLERNQERLLQIGPSLTRIHVEFLEQLIERQFNQLVRNNQLPEIPEELEGQALEITFISSLAIAQRSVAVGGIERLAGFVGNMVQAGFTQAAEKLNVDETIDQYADVVGAPARLIIPDEIVQERREQAARQEQAQQALAAAESAAKSAKSASEAGLADGENVLDKVQQATQLARGG